MARPLTPTEQTDSRLLLYWDFNNATSNVVPDKSIYNNTNTFSTIYNLADCLPEVLLPAYENMPVTTPVAFNITERLGAWNYQELPQGLTSLFGHSLIYMGNSVDKTGKLWVIGGSPVIGVSTSSGIKDVTYFDIGTNLYFPPPFPLPSPEFDFFPLDF